MRFEFEEDEELGFLDIILSKKDIVSLLDEDYCEGSYRNKNLLKMKLLICIRKEEDAIEER